MVPFSNQRRFALSIEGNQKPRLTSGTIWDRMKITAWLAGGKVAENDPLGHFLATCTAADPSGRLPSRRLYEAFVAWSKAAGEQQWNMVGFSKAMQDKGFVKEARDGLHWLGLRLTDEVSR